MSSNPKQIWSVPLNGYHSSNLTRLSDSLTKSNWLMSSVASILADGSVKILGGKLNCKQPKLPSAIVVMNDWAAVTKVFVDWARRLNIPTYAIVEGVNDFYDVDTDRKRNAYRSVDTIFLNGDFDRKYFSDFSGKIHIGGIDRLDELYDQKSSLPSLEKERRVVINCNFTYGVLTQHSHSWIEQVVSACFDMGLDYVISKHPADKTSVYPHKLTHHKLVDELIKSEIFVTRFSGAVLEALVAGCKVVYYNPGIERVDKFTDPVGAFLYASSPLELEQALAKFLNGWEPKVADFLKLHADFSVDRREPSDLAINKVASVICSDLKKNRWRFSWKRLVANFRVRQAFSCLARRLEVTGHQKASLKTPVDDLAKARALFSHGAYASAGVCYSHLNERSLNHLYDVNITFALKRIPSAQVLSLRSALDLAGIDQVYVLNLDRRPDRKLRMALEFARFGVKPTFVSAVDANEPFVDDIYDAHLKSLEPRGDFDAHLSEQHRQSIQGVLSKGAVAYKLSQKAILEDAHCKGFRRIAVFDDDVFFSDFVVKRLGWFVEKQPDDWKIVALGASDYSLSQLVPDVDAVASMDSKGFYTPVPGRTCGSFAMLYDHSVYEEIIKSCDYPSGTFDNTVLGAMYAKYPNQTFVLFPNVVTPCVEESDIRDSRNQLEQSQRMFWDLSNYKRWSTNLDVFFVCDDPGLAESALAKLDDADAVTIHFVASDAANSQITEMDLFAHTTTGALQTPNKIYELIFVELEKVRSPIDVKRFFVFLTDGGAV